MEFTFQFKGYALKLAPSEDKLKVALAEIERLKLVVHDQNLSLSSQGVCIKRQDDQLEEFARLAVDDEGKLKAANANLTDLRNQLGKANDLLAGYRKRFGNQDHVILTSLDNVRAQKEYELTGNKPLPGVSHIFD